MSDVPAATTRREALAPGDTLVSRGGSTMAGAAHALTTRTGAASESTDPQSLRTRIQYDVEAVTGPTVIDGNSPFGAGWSVRGGSPSYQRMISGAVPVTPA